MVNKNKHTCGVCPLNECILTQPSLMDSASMNCGQKNSLYMRPFITNLAPSKSCGDLTGLAKKWTLLVLSAEHKYPPHPLIFCFICFYAYSRLCYSTLGKKSFIASDLFRNE